MKQPDKLRVSGWRVLLCNSLSLYCLGCHYPTVTSPCHARSPNYRLVPELPPPRAQAVPGQGKRPRTSRLPGRVWPGEFLGWPSAGSAPGREQERAAGGGEADGNPSSSPAGCGSMGSFSWCKRAGLSQVNF